MGRQTFTEDAYKSARSQNTTQGKSATFRGEEQVRNTGKLDPLVDPAEYGVIRPSRIRLEPKGNLFEVTAGTPYPIEPRLDTTGSMGDNVDLALEVLPQICGLTAKVLPGRDPFYCASIFGDLMDKQKDRVTPGFPLCRGQFEVLAERMVNQLTLMHPHKDGCGNGGEDPHYGHFGAAFLTCAYLQLAGLKSFDFTITDEPMHEGFSPSQLKRIFGEQVFEKTAENGYDLDPRHLPSNREVVVELHKRAHAFALLVGGRSGSLRDHWEDNFGRSHVVVLPKIQLLPHVMATIIGLTEGTLDLLSAVNFLEDANLEKRDAQSVVDLLSHVPLDVQRTLPNYDRLPKKGDIFAEKTDLWPMDPKDVLKKDKKPGKAENTEGSGGWL